MYCNNLALWVTDTTPAALGTKGHVPSALLHQAVHFSPLNQRYHFGLLTAKQILPPYPDPYVGHRGDAGFAVYRCILQFSFWVHEIKALQDI